MTVHLEIAIVPPLPHQLCLILPSGKSRNATFKCIGAILKKIFITILLFYKTQGQKIMCVKTHCSYALCVPRLPRSRKKAWLSDGRHIYPTCSRGWGYLNDLEVSSPGKDTITKTQSDPKTKHWAKQPTYYMAPLRFRAPTPTLPFDNPSRLPSQCNRFCREISTRKPC